MNNPPAQGVAMTPAPNAITLDQIEKALPPHLKSAASQQLVDQINNITQDELLAETIRNNFLSYSMVMREGRFKLEDYLHAVTYVSYKIMGNSNQDAYALTFPARYAALMAKGTSSKDIAAYVSAYNKNKLVNLIYEQTLVPTWVLNQHVYQAAINTQFEIMKDEDVSPKVRVEAANSILTHLKKPDSKDFQIGVEIKETAGITELKDALKDMARTQQDLINRGVGVKDIAASPLIEVEAKSDTDTD
jgi:hypothetical protein